MKWDGRNLLVNLFDRTIDTLEKSLNYSALKNRTISNNIANVDTPNYKAQDVVFKKILEDKLGNSVVAKRTHPKHLSFHSNHHANYRVVTKHQTMYNHNRNNVDIDKEMAELAKNQIYNQAIIDRLNGEFSNIQTVIRGGN